jgi:hypothetical protein
VPMTKRRNTGKRRKWKPTMKREGAEAVSS